MRKEVYITVVILALLCACMSQATKKGRERSTSSRDAAGFSTTPKSPMGILDTIAYQILGGPQDASILTRIGNKIGQIATVLIGSLFGYFKFFRNRKNRQERINEYFGDEKHGFAVDADK